MTTPLPHLPPADVELKDARELHLRGRRAGCCAERVAARALGRGDNPASATRGSGVLDRAARRAPGDRRAGGDRRCGEQWRGGRPVALGDAGPSAIPCARRRRSCDGGRRIGAIASVNASVSDGSIRHSTVTSTGPSSGAGGQASRGIVGGTGVMSTSVNPPTTGLQRVHVGYLRPMARGSVARRTLRAPASAILDGQARSIERAESSDSSGSIDPDPRLRDSAGLRPAFLSRGGLADGRPI